MVRRCLRQPWFAKRQTLLVLKEYDLTLPTSLTIEIMDAGFYEYFTGIFPAK
jgi:hypothetical protein